MTDLFQNEPTPPPSQSPFYNQLEVRQINGMLLSSVVYANIDVGSRGARRHHSSA
jgi:hypothetical protein